MSFSVIILGIVEQSRAEQNTPEWNRTQQNTTGTFNSEQSVTVTSISVSALYFMFLISVY